VRPLDSYFASAKGLEATRQTCILSGCYGQDSQVTVLLARKRHAITETTRVFDGRFLILILEAIAPDKA
jgi:hypothetical protein